MKKFLFFIAVAFSVMSCLDGEPKPTLEATEEYLEGNIYYRNPAKEDQQARRFEELEENVIKEL